MRSPRNFGAVKITGAKAGISEISAGPETADNLRIAFCETSLSDASFHNCAANDM